MKNVYGIFVSILYIGLVFVSAKVLFKSGKEVTRKYMHILLSNWWIIAMVFFDNVYYASIMPLAFVFINYASYKWNLIKMMERESGDENKESLGTVYYAISLLVLAIVTFGIIKNPLVGLCGILMMGYGDGLAAVIGQGVESPKFKIGGKTKSIAGCMAMFIVCLIIMSGFFTYCNSAYIIVKSILVACLMTILEAIGIKGTDNISVPLIGSLLAFLMM